MADKKQDIRINEKIKEKEVRLIGAQGEPVGVVQIEEALKMARTENLDLVEVAPNAKPPVCRLLDYGKYKFEQEKKTKESKKKQTQVKMKEIRMQPKIDVHDMEFKAKHIKEFLDSGFKVKVTVRFRGRELAHTELGVVVLEKVLELLADGYIEEKKPNMEGRFMSMLLSPKSTKK